MESIFTRWNQKFRAYLHDVEGKIYYNQEIMSFETITVRQHKLISYLRSRPRSFKEIEGCMIAASEDTSLELDISQRTLQRDIKSIATIYDVEIIFDTVLKKYRILEETKTLGNTRILGTLDVLLALTSEKSLSDQIKLQAHYDINTGLLAPLLKAIKQGVEISFRHRKNYTQEPKERRLRPYGLKEHDQRWYVFGQDIDKDEFRIFSLDRMSDIKLTTTLFRSPQPMPDYFKYTYGVEMAQGIEPTRILLTIKATQANFLKSLPLHHSQSIIKENEDYTTFEFLLVPMHNFIMKILSFGGNIVALEPKELRVKILDKLRDTIKI